MTIEDIIKYMAQLKSFRATMYLSKDKMEQWYLQKVSPILEMGEGKVFSGKIGASLLGAVKSEAGGQTSSEAKVAVDNEIVQGVVAENVARASDSLVVLSKDQPSKGELCYYLGAAHTTVIDELVSPDKTGLSDAQCATIQTVRNAQENSLKLFYPEVRTMTLTFQAKDRVYAAICSSKSVNPNWPTSYAFENNFGILCTLERQLDDVTFLDPIWIWHE